MSKNSQKGQGKNLDLVEYNIMDARIAKGKETKKRHKTMKCQVFELKVDKSSLNKVQREFLTRLFLEAKWFYNYCIGFLNHRILDEADTTAKTVKVRLGDGSHEERPLKVLPGTCKQVIVQRIFCALKTLKTLRAQGKKTGDIRFTSPPQESPRLQSGDELGQTPKELTQKPCMMYL